jgi:dUTP pyrophosphatase
MAVSYYLELFPTEGNWNSYVNWFGGTEVDRNNDNAGVDLYCVQTQYVLTIAPTLLDLGVKARMTKFFFDYENGNRVEKSEPCHFWLAPRSSISKSGVRQANSIGVIDRSYRGVLMGAVLANTRETNIEAGTRLFQILAPDMGYIAKVTLKPLSDLDETTRGSGGFGSTGK